MFFVVHKNSVILGILILLAGIMTTATWVFQAKGDVPAFSVPMSNKVVVIDAGHGGKFKANRPMYGKTRLLKPVN